MNLAVTVSLETVYIYTHILFIRKKASIFPYALLKLFVRDG